MQKRLILLPFIFLSFLPLLFFGQKNDTVYHVNGNILTGDFKKLAYGVVTWKMDGMGTISLEEPKINGIISKKLFEIRLKDGMTYFGSFDTSGIPHKVNINVTNGKIPVLISDIVEVYPLKKNFWLRTSGKFSLGLNYSKGSDVATVAFSGNLSYRKKSSYFNLSWDDDNTFQADTLSSTKADLNLAWERNLKKKWLIGLGAGVSQNSQLGTKFRFNYTTIGIRDIVYNNWNRFFVGAGLSYQRETPYEDAEVSNDLAGTIIIAWKVYKYTNPKVWVEAGIAYVPYFTDTRTRVNINLTPQISVWADNFKVGINSYYSYDSKTSGNSGNNDWGINLQLSFSFH